MEMRGMRNEYVACYGKRRRINPTYYSLINDELWSLNMQGVGNWINDLAKNNLKRFS